MSVLGFMSAIEGHDPNKPSPSWFSQEDIEYHCYNRILSALSDHLYDVYHFTTSTAKELWDALETEYEIVDAAVDRFTVSNFNSYKMVETKSVGDQIREYQELLRDIEKKGTKFSEDFKVSCLIDKLPPSWNEYAKSLRHKQGEFTLRQAMNSLRIEEKQRVDQKGKAESTPVVNLVVGNRNHNQNKTRFHNKNGRNNFQPRGMNFKNNRASHNKQFQKSKDQRREKMSCFVSGRTNHMAKNCFYQKTEEIKSQVNMTVEQESSQLLFKVIVKDNDETPYEIWKKRTPNLHILKVWGCLAKVLIHDPKRKKIGPKTVDVVFLGYAHHSIANKFLVINSEIEEISNNTIIECRDATYFEDIFPFKSRIQNQTVDIVISNAGKDTASSSNPVVKETKSLEEIRRSKRMRKEKNFGEDFVVFHIKGDPATYKEAMASSDAPFCKETINSEVESILQNHTWELTNLPPGTRAIGCKWVFRKKLKPDGSIDKYKARLVAKDLLKRKV
ncbi:hypothetical protein ACLB2K_046713 [Fragaria x ananassa]